MAEKQESKLIKLGDKIYETDSITELGNALMNDIKKVDEEIVNINTTIGIYKLAKAKLIDELIKESSKFKEAEIQSNEIIEKQ